MSKESHVKVWYDEGWHVSLDGQTIEHCLMPDGLRVEFTVKDDQILGRPPRIQPVVHLTVVPDEFRADLPDALVEAVKRPFDTLPQIDPVEAAIPGNITTFPGRGAV